jgi:hypothetical protein
MYNKNYNLTFKKNFLIIKSQFLIICQIYIWNINVYDILTNNGSPYVSYNDLNFKEPTEMVVKAVKKKKNNHIDYFILLNRTHKISP